MKTLRTLGAVAVTGTVLALVPAGSALADPSDTTTATFTLAGGSLDVSAPTSAPLGDSVSGDTLITGGLGEVVVSDTRGVTNGWTMSAGSTTFTRGGGGANSTSTGVSYDAGTSTASSGTVTPTSTGPTPLQDEEGPRVAVVAAGTLASGNNTATFQPTLDVTLPASALAGAYTGTVTTSVL